MSMELVAILFSSTLEPGQLSVMPMTIRRMLLFRAFCAICAV
jgi:hypothetical protein